MHCLLPHIVYQCGLILYSHKLIKLTSVAYFFAKNNTNKVLLVRRVDEAVTQKDRQLAGCTLTLFA